MKTYIAYAVTYGESPCGCNRTYFHHVYDHIGNNHKEFTSKEEAEVAARAKMEECDADNWLVI